MKDAASNVGPARRKAYLPTVKIGGVEVARLSRRTWAKRIVLDCQEARSAARIPPFYSSANGNVLSHYAKSGEFRAAFDQAQGIDADGMPIVLASRWLTGHPVPERCATTDFFHDMADAACHYGLSMYFLGGTEETNRKAVVASSDLHPGLRIAGRHHGYFSQEDEPAIVEQIVAAAPDVLWIGLGVPREQSFVARNIAKLTTVGVVKTCGGLFDFIAGRPRAPKWMQDASLEWLYRTVQEPGRLAGRYASTNFHAVWLILTRSGGRSAESMR
jgi:N-acetylglucosaminyldiphosphoundecaprenol N-acetyl-beta-D-mannosaminyltransferase